MITAKDILIMGLSGSVVGGIFSYILAYFITSSNIIGFIFGIGTTGIVITSILLKTGVLFGNTYLLEVGPFSLFKIGKDEKPENIRVISQYRIAKQALENEKLKIKNQTSGYYLTNRYSEPPSPASYPPPPPQF